MKKDSIFEKDSRKKGTKKGELSNQETGGEDSFQLLLHAG